MGTFVLFGLGCYVVVRETRSWTTAAAIVTNEAEHITVLLGALGNDPIKSTPDAFVTGKK